MRYVKFSPQGYEDTQDEEGSALGLLALHDGYILLITPKPVKDAFDNGEDLQEGRTRVPFMHVVGYLIEEELSGVFVFAHIPHVVVILELNVEVLRK
jgi:hypothetical protein